MLRTFSLLLVLCFLSYASASGQDKSPNPNSSLVMLTATVSDCNDRYLTGLNWSTDRVRVTTIV